jgi:creatinine amidohydrolase/Fe(II)-dependent formamide hydrolase-like protein
MGKLAEHGAAAIPTLEAVVADPEKFGCKRSHPDYSKFISVSKESLSQIRAALAKKGGQK